MMANSWPQNSTMRYRPPRSARRRCVWQCRGAPRSTASASSRDPQDNAARARTCTGTASGEVAGSRPKRMLMQVPTPCSLRPTLPTMPASVSVNIWGRRPQRGSLKTTMRALMQGSQSQFCATTAEAGQQIEVHSPGAGRPARCSAMPNSSVRPCSAKSSQRARPAPSATPSTSSAMSGEKRRTVPASASPHVRTSSRPKPCSSYMS
mmetsp:Transcript_41241/g.116711  ORF Transcript_41241/g.116711 Transcript_41241/m.116711 type:complete len:207 (+) Transcript_41241:188-808(+)